MSLDLKEEYDKIYTFCYFKIKHQAIAEDITQETFLKYFETSNYLEKGKKLAFLYTIARNLCMDHYRKKRHAPIDDLELSEDDSSKLETKIAVQVAVSKLEDVEQEIVLLRYKNELQINEIASYLGISRFALRRRLKHIEDKLKSDLRKEDFYG